MGRSIFKELGQLNQQSQQSGDIGKNFDAFVNNFEGNPMAELQRLRSSGQMSPDMYNRLYSMASGIAARFRR